MKIGLLTAAFPGLSLKEVASWASDSGFQMLEIACWPAGEGKDRKYGGVVHIDMDSLTGGKASEINGYLSEKNLEISSLGYYPNILHPDLSHREHVTAHLKKVIEGAGKLGVGAVGTFIGRTWDTDISGRVWQKDIDHNFDLVKQIWPDILKYASIAR
jgi:sugar phosphate isomerase/epimerase